MLEGSDINEKRGAILGIGCLAEVDFLSISGHCGQFTSLVKSLAASGDLPTLVLGARLLGQFGLLFSSDFVDLQIKGACDSLLMANQSNSQKEFNILLLREIALHTPTSFYQHLEQFLKAVLPSFREKEVIVRDLAALALRSALAISAENEVSCQGREALSSTGRLGEAADSPDALFYSQSSKSDAGGGPRKQVGRGGSLLVPASRKISQTQIPTDMPPMTWYQACVRELLFKYSDAIALKPSDQHSTNKYSPSYRKMTSDEWLHGRLLILNELLVSANPEFEKVRSSLDTMLGQAMFHVLIANQTEGETAVQTVHLTQWAVVSAPTAAASAAVAAVVSSGLPRSALSSTTARPAAGEVFGDEGIASELFRQQQLRQQRAVPVASAACRRVLADNMEQTLMNFLFDCVNRDREKAYALVTLGLMAQSLGAEFETGGYMTRLFEILSSLISPSKETASKKRPAGLSTAVLLTVGLLTKALGSKVYPYLKPLLDPIISRGLSQPMAAVCSLIAENVPELKRNVQDNLLKRINLVLANASAAGTLLSPAGGVGGLMTQSTSAAVTAAAAVTAPSGGRFSVVGTSRLVAAFTPHRSSISRSPLLPSSTSATGRTGSITLPGTAAMPIGWGDAFGGLLKSGGGSGALDHEGTGGDPLSDSMLAAVALRTLGSFDFEAWAVLAELLIDLSDSGSSRNKEESASLLAILVATSPRFVAPYAEPLLHILVPQIRNALPISLRLRLLAMRNASLQKSAAKLGGADFFDCQKASLTTALLTSQSAAHAAAQTVQAVATATARAGGAPGNGGGTDKAAGTASTAIRGGGNAGGANQQLFGARAIAAANHAATTASIAAKVVAAAVGRQGLNFGGPATVLLDDFEKFNSNLGFASPPRVISNLDLLIGDPNESLPGTNQDFLSVAAELDLTNLTNALSSMSECLDDSHALASKGLFCAPKAGQPEGSAVAMWREPTPVVVALFSVLGHLSGVCPAAVVPLMDDLLPILTCMLQDSTCYAKRSIAAWTLSVMITNTGFVVLPYLKHPDLLDLLFGLLKREESKNIQAEIVRLLGLIGAVDPFKLKMCAGQMDSLQDTGVAVSMHDTVESREIDITQSELLVNFFWESKEEFFAAYCLSALINLLREPVMRSQCDKVVLAIYNVVSSLGQRSIPYLHQVMRELFQCLQSLQDARLQETLLYHLGSIVSIIGPHAKEFVHDVVNIIVAHWWISPAVQRAAIRLLGSVSNVLGSDFRPFISRLTPTLLRMLKQETDETNLKALFDLMGDLGVLLEGHVHILVPTMAHLIGNTEEESLDLLLRSALEQSTNAASGAAFPSQPTTDSSSTAAAAASSCSPESVELMATAGSSPPLNAPLGQDASTVLLEDNWRPGALLQWTSAGSQRQAFAGGCHVVGSIALRRAGLQCFLKFTECLALDSLCATITHPICRLLTLLHERQYLAGGVGSGTGAGGTGGSSLLQQAGGAPPASHLGGSGGRQGRSGVGGSNAGLSGTGGGGGMAGARAALQALFPPCMDVITNLLARMGPKFQVVMPIVQMTLNLLGMSHPAFSTVLSKADEELWYEKLRDWDRAIALCDRKLEDERIKDKTKPILCRLRCLHSLGQWGQLDSMAWERWNGVSEVTRQQMAPLATSAAITVGAWDRAEHYANSLPASSYEAGFYRSVLALHTGNYARALDEVAKARAVLAADLTPLTGEGYLRAYPDLVAAQLLAEVEEVIQYKLIPERCAVLHDSWHKRLIGCHSVVEDWGRIIQLRRLVLDPNKNIRSCLRYAGLCRRSGRLSLSLQVLLSVMGFNPATVPPTQPIIGPEPSTVFAYTKILWASGSKEEAFTRLRVLREAILEPMLCAETTTTNGVVVGGARHDYVNVDPTASAAAGAAGTVGSTYSSTAAQAAVSAAASAGNWCDLASASVDAAAVRARMSDLRKLLSKVCMRLGNWYSELYLRTPSEVVTLPGSKSAGTHLASPSIGQPYSGVGDVQQTNLLLSLDGGSSGRAPCVNLLDEKAVYSHRFVINCYRTATEHTPGNRFAWQAWAIANYDLFTRLGMEKAQLEQYEGELRQAFNAGLDIPYRSQPSEAPFASAGDHPGNQSAQQTPAATVQQTLAALAARRAVLQRSMEQLAAPSVRGYINSISISPDANLQDSLRLINLLFQFGHLSEIRDLIREGFGKIRLQNWLVVLQQLLARIDTPLEHVANIIVDLLVAVGRRYPQALVFSLVLAFKSGGSDRRRYYANKILYSMEEHSQQLVSEAFLLNEELIRISITWVEMWAECLEDASRVYFGEKDIGKMFRLLHPLHLVMDRGHETNNEAAFLQQFGTELTNCRLYCERFEQLGAKADLQQAWDGYYTLYRNFSKLVSNMSILELTVTAPRLQAYGKDWQLAVPGSYKPQRPLIRMAGVKNCLTVMTSKQHPRRLTILGSNGQNYVFLLKGHEDTRQDERIMQFFGLVNTLLMSEPETLRRNLTYAPAL
nr:unnamed protein product [Spirometra erinaceieuropaei]